MEDYVTFLTQSLLFQTYNMDAQIGESSACATALMCGVKTNFETVGLDVKGRFENCFSSFSSRIPSLIDWAQESGKLLAEIKLKISKLQLLISKTKLSIFQHIVKTYLYNIKIYFFI